MGLLCCVGSSPWLVIAPRGKASSSFASCAAGLYTAASTLDRIAFHTLNKPTGNRVHRIFIDSETGKPVEREDQTKGFEIENSEYVMIDPEEVAATVPESDKTLATETLIPCSDEWRAGTNRLDSAMSGEFRNARSHI